MKIVTNNTSSQFTRNVLVAKHARITLLFSFLVLICLVGFAPQANAQAVLHSVGATTICNGESTTIAVNIDGGYEPYTVVYSNGTNNFTVSDYHSNDTNGDDPITVSPTTTTTYSLVSITFGSGTSLPVDPATVAITVNPLPSALSISTSPTSPVCPGVNFTISATATNGNTYELWNAANTVKIDNLPYVTSIVANTSYTVRAISSFGCTISQAYAVTVDNIKPTITCPANQNLNTNSGSCNATLPDYTSGITVADNCTATGSIVKTQSPVAGTTLSGGHNSTQLVTMTATDASGNFQTCTFTVTVKDAENPLITGTATSTSKNTNLGQCYYTVSGVEFDPTNTSDNCGILKRTSKYMTKI